MAYCNSTHTIFSVCRVWIVCKCSICLLYPNYLLHLPKCAVCNHKTLHNVSHNAVSSTLILPQETVTASDLSMWKYRVVNQTGNNLGLDQVVTLSSDVFEVSQDVDSAFVLYLLQHAVYDYVCACSAHSSTAGHKERDGLIKTTSHFATKQRGSHFQPLNMM